MEIDFKFRVLLVLDTSAVCLTKPVKQGNVPIITPKQGLSEKSLIGFTLVGSKLVGVELNGKGCRYEIYDPLFKQLTLSLTVNFLGLVQGLVRFMDQLFNL